MTPWRSHLRHFTFEQEGSEPDLASTDLCEKGALVLEKLLTLLEGVV
jgi:hypothetical protein